jgi:tetratricopeptide (TPR) repeat protein
VAVVEEASAVGDPSVAGEAHLELGRVLLARGELEKGVAHVEDAAVQAQAAQDRVLAARAWVQLASTTALRMQKNDEARRWLRYARAAVAAAPQELVVEAQLDSTEALILQSEGRLAEAEVLFERASRETTAALGPKSWRLSLILNNLLVNHIRSGKCEQGISVGEQVLAYRTEVFGPEHPSIAQVMNNLALCYATVGQGAKAVEATDRALAARVKLLGPDNGELIWNYHDACVVYGIVQRFPEALARCERAVALSTAKFGGEHPNTADMLSMLGNIQRQAGNCPAAMRTLTRALGIKKALGPTHPDLAEMNKGIGLCQLEQGAVEQAAATLELALAGFLRSSTETTDMALVQVGLARAFKKLRRDSARVRELADAAAKVYEAKGVQFAADAKQARALAQAN